MTKRKPTLAEVAKVAGVSRMTASRAMNNQPGLSEKTREDILRIADEMGYVTNPMAQKLSAGKTRIIGVIAQFHTPFTSDLVLGIGSQARGMGYEMLVYSLPENHSQPPGSVLSLLQQISDGVIAILPYEAGYLEIMANASVPVVTVDTREDESTFPSVSADSYQGGRQAMIHLSELGHRRIGIITGNCQLTSARIRLQAYRDAVAQFGLDADEGLIADGNYSEKGGFDAASALLALPERPTAIFACNDLSALGAMAAVREAGLRIPEDISIVGFDDILLASQVYPALTTVRQPLQEMGRSAVNMLLALIVGLDLPTRQTILPTHLVNRDSTSRPGESAERVRAHSKRGKAHSAKSRRSSE
ncbi:LacI family DNA-binding transcriptional regulator [Tropicimonas isoalkanivorans]|uniref:Transcriptional regulator, LacI family n=1 Tax=Tropicimonas isoalkanivorans TaxID=441112 RepID=A0A1I1Q420_9RHOB|nr:LacI family DNA-binding transcriptional regulator [Tropicimonas isoalkanivorans]SFD16712.1 transcriptional regulator, LacI family [Tropicimonas isoalkanivorans]